MTLKNDNVEFKKYKLIKNLKFNHNSVYYNQSN